MFKSVKMHDESYAIVKNIAKNDKRSFATTLDIIIQYYKEKVKCQKVIK